MAARNYQQNSNENYTRYSFQAFLGLAVQHRLAEEAYIFCCCAFFISLFFRQNS